MMFKNESDVVAKKAEKRYEALAKQKVLPLLKKGGQEHGEESVQLVPWTGYPSPESMILEITPSIEDQAQGFFIANYVAQPTIVPRGQFEWVTELLSQPNPEEILTLSVNAASLAGLAISTKSSAIMQKARAAYVDALRVTNSALSVKKTAVKDSTLIAVIMLGMYENMAFQGKQSIQAWIKHVAGACTLLKLRGKEQFESSISRRIFHQFYGVVLLVALETGTPVHEGMHELYEALHPTSDYDVHGRQFTTRVVNVMYDAVNLNQDRFSNPVTMVNTALRIDLELEKIKGLMPSIWHFETVYLETSSNYQYGDSYHVYFDPWLAQMWNHLRSCRLYLYRIMRENITKASEQYDPPLLAIDEMKPLKEAADEVMRTTAAGVIASVPQISGMIPFPDLAKLKREGSMMEGIKDHALQYKLHAPGTFLNPSKSTGLVHLIWPLYAAGQADIASGEMRQWCIEMLHIVALRIGTRQAVVLADELQRIQSGVLPAASKSSDFFFSRVSST